MQNRIKTAVGGRTRFEPANRLAGLLDHNHEPETFEDFDGIRWEPVDEPDDSSESRRYGQLDRLIDLAEIIAEDDRLLSGKDLASELNRRRGSRVSERTVFRDLVFLLGMGLIEKYQDGGSVVYQWSARRSDRAKAMLEMMALRREDNTPREICSSLSPMLRRLPPPWQLSAAEMKAATQAARILAMIDTQDTSYADGVLVFRLGDGWELRRLGYDAPTSLLSALDDALDSKWVQAIETLDAMREGA